MLDEIFIAIIAFLGLIVGYIVSWNAKEELKPGRKYFLLLKNALVVLLFLVLIYFNFNLVALIVGLVIGYFLRFYYIYLGFVVGSGFLVNQGLLFSLLVFLFGLSYSSLERFNVNKVILSLVLFFIAFFVVLFYPYEFFISFSAGALLWRLK